MSAAAFKADCTRCAALCCMAPSFDVSEDFALAKPAETACPKLAPSGRCTIHSDREALGFRGCIAADCYGAGQRVTQDLFQGRSWLDDPSLKAPMARAYQRVRRVHELMMLLGEAQKLPLSHEDQLSAAAYLNQLEKLAGSAEPPTDDPLPGIARDVHAYLRSLSHLLV